MLEQQAPNEVNPTSDAWNAETEDESQKVIEIRFFDQGSDTHNDFDDPVDTRNQKQDELDQSRKTIEPFHCRCSPYGNIIHFISFFERILL